MAAKNDVRVTQTKKELKRRLQLHGTLAELDLLFGMSPGYFYNLISGDTKVSMPFLWQVDTKLKISPVSVLRAVTQEAFEDPVDVLLACRENAQLPASPFLDELIPRIVAVLESEVARDVSVASELPVLEALEEQRFSDRKAAREACEKLAAKILQTLEGIPGPKPRKLVGELAAALGLWGSIQRSRGFRDLAVKTFALAFPLANHSDDPWALGVCFQRAAYVLGDLGRSDLGYDFIRDALVFFSAGGSVVSLWKCHMDRGHFLTNCGKLDDARKASEWALERLPGSEWRNRMIALQGLGVIARRQGELQKARDFLIAAAAECQCTDILLGHVKWSRGRVEAELGQLSLARNLFDEATALMTQYGSAGDVALICVDHVEILLKQGEPRRAALMVAEVAAWLPRLRANPILCRAFAEFLDLARAARIELAKLPEIREDLQKAWKQGEAP